MQIAISRPGTFAIALLIAPLAAFTACIVWLVVPAVVSEVVPAVVGEVVPVVVQSVTGSN